VDAPHASRIQVVGGAVDAGDLADPSFEDRGEVLSRVHVRTEVLTGVQQNARTAGAFEMTAPYATVTGQVIDGTGKLLLASSAYVHEGTFNNWATTLTMAARIQLATALIDSELVAPLYKAELAVSPHPTLGFRSEPHRGIDYIKEVIAPAGVGRSAFIGPGFEEAKRMAGSQLSVLTTADETGLTAEFPFGEQTALFQMLTEAPNPRMGNGLLMTLKLPVNISRPECASLAVDLNLREQSEFTRAPFLGSWCVSPGDESLAFVSFLPNAADSSNAAILNFFYYAAARSQWALESVFGGDYQGSWKTAAPALARAMQGIPPGTQNSAPEAKK
jgi:hypothetical protein